MMLKQLEMLVVFQIFVFSIFQEKNDEKHEKSNLTIGKSIDKAIYFFSHFSRANGIGSHFFEFQKT